MQSDITQCLSLAMRPTEKESEGIGASIGLSEVFTGHTYYTVPA